MESLSEQQVLYAPQVTRLGLWPASSSCHYIWDCVETQTDKRLLTLVSSIPAVLGVCVLIIRGLSPLLYRPKWTKPFIQELDERRGTLKSDKEQRLSQPTVLLLSISFVGFALQATKIFYPRFSVAAVGPAVTWVIMMVLIAIDRPKTTPVGLLPIIAALVVIQVGLLFEARDTLGVQDILSGIEVIATIFAIVVIFRMPFRNPDLPSDQISQPFEIPTHQLRSPEDNMTLWQFMTVSWMAPLMALGSARQLNNEDVWSLGFEFQQEGLHNSFRELSGSVVKRLLVANGIDLVVTTFLGVAETVANVTTPVLLQQLLRSMDSSSGLRSDAVKFAVLALLVRLITAQSSVFSLWFSRRCYERSRGEMITMLYEKTLARKIIGAPTQDIPTVNPSDSTQTDALAISHASAFYKTFHRAKESLLRIFIWRSRGKQTPKEAEMPASMGKILNLMRNDVYEVSQRFWEFQSLITDPLMLILSVVLIWKLIGWPCLAGALTVIAAQGLNAFFTRVLLRWERKRRSATDTRLQKSSQFVEAIRHLRWYGWEDFWKNEIMQSRQEELVLRTYTRFWRILINFTNTLASGMFPVAAFYAYTALAGQPLRIDVAFPALQLFSMLEGSLREIPGLITVLLNAKVAVDRIEDFMAEPDKEHQENLSTGGESRLTVQDASFAWPGKSLPVLRDISLEFTAGLTVICGKVAAGKTALLQALLGELDTLSGEVKNSNEMIGYCAQTPWLQSMNIRDNILFSSPFEDARYRQVLKACALTHDLASFKHGDLSNIGENGIGLSGGQKARVALARAVYSRTKILLLDDPLSALDQETAETIMRDCIGGPLLEHRIVVLVTHRTELCYGLAAQVVEISEGTVRSLDREEALSTSLSRIESKESTQSTDKTKIEEQEKAAVPEKFMEDEHRAHGGVKASIYWEYIRAGKFKWWALLICVLTLYRMVAVGETWFLKSWGEAYSSPSEIGTDGLFVRLPSPQTDIRPWLLGFFLIAVGKATMMLLSHCVMAVIIYAAGRQMFKDIMERVSHATFRFYDVTPVGRLMNRMTSDIGTVDGNISHQFQAVVWLIITWVTSVVVIGSVTPVFLVFSAVLAVCFVLIFRRFLPTSQSLRRLEMVSLSPLMSNFGALLEGLTTVRAFCAQKGFQDRVIAVVDNFQKMDHFYWSLQAWLMYRFDALSACSTFILTLLAIYTGVSPGLTAFVLISAGQFVSSTHALCKQYGRLQMEFVSVERVVELLHLEQEPSGSVDPPASWPSYDGDIVFENVTIRYAPHLDPSLSDLSFRIPGGSTTALLGRTGSGKSTLALSLLATTLPASGRILIDNIDVSEVNIQALRNRVTFLAQDPVLFPGSMRNNLDPMEDCSDDACEVALKRVCGTHEWTLKTQIDSGGRNLSQGQRQLVGLARAVLRRSSIIILDEATASIDTATAMQIQQVLREEMRESTVITIAHRLEAVKNADYYIRLENGRLVAQGSITDEMTGEGSGGVAGLM